MKELLLREDCTVIIVNWLGGAGPPYTQAVANTRLVGAMTARLAAQLIEVGGMSPSKMHCIGHSLGAHTSGYIGYHLRNRYGYTLGRITGKVEKKIALTSELRISPRSLGGVSCARRILLRCTSMSRARDTRVRF